MGSQTMKIGDWKDKFMLAANIVDTCHQFCSASRSKQGGESVQVKSTLKAKNERYLLRPEVIESVFYMWRYTHDQKVFEFKNSTAIGAGTWFWL
jgi:mannosyl-oligosaccharide alpha-1,2-mannosidase